MIPLFKRKLLPGLTSVGLCSEGACIVRIEPGGGQRPVLTLFAMHAWEEEGSDQAKLLTRLTGRYDLDRARCTTVLDAADYTLVLTEAPDVPAEELRAALRWRIKDLIDFHINDATLDVFELPGEKVTGRSRPMYVVAARSAAIQRRVDLMNAAGVNLDIIDIPELAQRNLAALLPEDAKGVAMLSFAPDSGLLTITRQGELYLSRSLDIGLEALAQFADPAAYFDRVMLEVQRSLDYYESHFRQAPVTAIALAPAARIIGELAGYLQDHLNVTARLFVLHELLDCRADVPAELSACCLMTIGAALREEPVAL